jgi:hypothetical protein
MQIAMSMKRNKNLFLDRKAVEDIVGKKAAKTLTKAGSYTRQRARASLKVSKRQRADADFYKQNQPSPPGRAPRSWSEHQVASLRNIQYQFDPKNMSVLVGPLKLNIGGMGSETIPGIHERGGTLRIMEWRFNQIELMRSWLGWRKYRSSVKFANEWRRRDLRWRDASRKRRKHTLSHIGLEQRTRAASFPARPFMGPALKKVAPKFPSLFARSV